MMKSMTAYAASESATDALSVSAEIRSYNSRHLDIVLRMPSGFLALEEKLKELISARVTRGRLEVKIFIDMDTPDAGRFEIDGTDVTKFSENELAAFRNRIMGFVFQQFNLVPYLFKFKQSIY